MSALNVNLNSINEIRRSKAPVLLDFYAEWCGPCRRVLPLVDEIARERRDIVVGKVNVENERELAEQFGVVSIPTLVVLKGGKVVKKVSGARPKDQIIALVDG